jgi:hypothetical protein
MRLGERFGSALSGLGLVIDAVIGLVLLAAARKTATYPQGVITFGSF